jgi:DNA repair protein RadC
MDGDSDAVPDYELLELVLFRAIPRRDTKALAKRLIARFGSFAEVLNASEKLLREVNGIDDAVVFELKLARAASPWLMRAEIIDKPVLSSRQQVIDYRHADLCHRADPSAQSPLRRSNPVAGGHRHDADDQIGGATLGIALHDHIIVGRQGHNSLITRGLI